MNEQTDLPPEPSDPNDDCPLPVGVQHRNIGCFAVYWAIYYLVAPVSYIGLTHANLLKALGNNDKICNLPSAVYMWLTIVPVVVAWLFPQPRYLKTMIMISVSLMAAITATVAVTLWIGAPPRFTSAVVIGHAAVFGGASGVLLTALWDALRRGVSTSRRGAALGFTFGIGPLFACVGALLQDAVFDGKLLGGHSFGLEFPHNYMAMFATVSPMMIAAGVVMGMFTLPKAPEPAPDSGTPLAEIFAGVRQFVRNRAVWFAVVIYVVAYSGGNAILSNVSLHAKTVLARFNLTDKSLGFLRAEGVPEAILLKLNPLKDTEFETRQIFSEELEKILSEHELETFQKRILDHSVDETDTLGIQSFLRFGFKAVAGAMLGWLLATASPRATLLATTSILLLGMGWALGSTGWWFMVTFGLLGAGELFGAYFPNYVTTASEKKFVRVNMAYLNVLSTLIGFSSLAFGAISDSYGRIASFYVAAGLLVFALFLIGLLPADPTPRESFADTIH